jgi:hypothetical protein
LRAVIHLIVPGHVDMANLARLPAFRQNFGANGYSTNEPSVTRCDQCRGEPADGGTLPESERAQGCGFSDSSAALPCWTVMASRDRAANQAMFGRPAESETRNPVRRGQHQRSEFAAQAVEWIIQLIQQAKKADGPH